MPGYQLYLMMGFGKTFGFLCNKVPKGLSPPPRVAPWLKSEMLLVIPLCFIRIELGTGLSNSIQGKSLNELVHTEDFLVRSWVPPKESK